MAVRGGVLIAIAETEAFCFVVAGMPQGDVDLEIAEEILGAPGFAKDASGVWTVRNGPAAAAMHRDAPNALPFSLVY